LYRNELYMMLMSVISYIYSPPPAPSEIGPTREKESYISKRLTKILIL